jgi:AraC-like DNA-binding protein
MRKTSPEEALKLKTRLFNDLSIDSNCYKLFNHLPGISFFVKDLEGRHLAANDLLLQLYGYEKEEEFIGLTDLEILPRNLAEKFRRDDRKLFRSGKAILNIVEIFPNIHGIPEWFITHKLPMFSKSGKILQKYTGYSQIQQPYMDITGAIDYIKEHYREDIKIHKLAGIVDLSLRQFQRKFKHNFNTTPQNYIIQMRIYNACELLRLRKSSISDIAYELGFYDQSAFTNSFKNHMGLTPLQYQKQY